MKPNFPTALDVIFDASLSIMNQYTSSRLGHRSYFDCKSYVREYNLLQLNLGRQKGHTTLIRSRYREGDLVIVPTLAMAKLLFDSDVLVITYASLSKIAEYDTVFECLPSKVRNVWIDCASVLLVDKIINYLDDLKMLDYDTNIFALG